MSEFQSNIKSHFLDHFDGSLSPSQWQSIGQLFMAMIFAFLIPGIAKKMSQAAKNKRGSDKYKDTKFVENGAVIREEESE